MDGEEDLPVQPTDGIENQDPLGPLPTAPSEDESQIDSDIQSESDDPTAGLNEIQQTLTEAANAADANSTDTFTPPATPESAPEPVSPATTEPSAPPAAVADVPPPDDLPTETTVTEASGPDFAELDDAQQQLQSFGEQVNAFNEAGGAGGGGGDYGSAFNGDYGGDGSSGALQDFGESVANNAEMNFEFLREHARRIDEMTRKLELERL